MVIDGQYIYVNYHIRKNCKNNYLIIHGGPGESCISFRYFIEYLMEFANVIEVDQRGCGRSEAVHDTETICVNMITDDFEKIRNQLGVERWNIIGHSFGGFLALIYANRYPEPIDKIILENPAIDLFDSLSCIVHNYYKYFIKRRKLKYIKNLIKAAATKDIVVMLDAVNNIPTHHKRFFWSNDLLNEEAEELLNFSDLTAEQKNNCQKFFNIIKHDQSLSANGWELLDGVASEVIFLSGEHDRIINSKIKHKILKYKNIRFIKIPNSGHYLHLADAARMCKIISEF